MVSSLILDDNGDAETDHRSVHDIFEDFLFFLLLLLLLFFLLPLPLLFFPFLSSFCLSHFDENHVSDLPNQDIPFDSLILDRQLD